MPDRPATPFRPVGVATPVVEATAGAASAVAFGVASAVRRARAFHPDGVAFHATVDIDGGGGLPSGHHVAVVRFSRGAGLPEPLPDILGLALRLVDVHGPAQHQDLLFVTSGSLPFARHALVPARSFGHARWSTILPYEIDRQRRVVFGARPLTPALGDARRLDDLRRVVAGGGVRFALDLAEVTGRWDGIGVLDIGEELEAATGDGLRFNPANTGPRSQPVGVLQTVRRLAYRGSQEGRPARE